MSDDVIKVRREDLEGTTDHIYAHVLIGTMYMQLGLDLLAGTPYYKQRVKNTCKTLHQDLSIMIQGDLTLLCQNGADKKMYLIADEIEQILDEVIITPVEYAGIILELIRKFKKNPQEVMEFMGINLINKESEV